MSRAIWKFPFEIVGMQTISMPVGARILACQTQFNTPCLWALVDPSAAKEDVQISVIGTSYEMSVEFAESLEYIGTFQKVQGTFIWHVFQRRMSEPIAPAAAEVREEVPGRFVVEAAATKQTARGALVAVVAAMEMLGGTQ